LFDIAERARGGWRREKPDVRTPPVFPESADGFDADGDEEEYDYDEGSSSRSFRATQWQAGQGNGCGVVFCLSALLCNQVTVLCYRVGPNPAVHQHS